MDLAADPWRRDIAWPVLEDLEESPLELLTDLWGGVTRLWYCYLWLGMVRQIL